MNLYKMKNRLCWVVAAIGCCLLPFGCTQEEGGTGVPEPLDEMPLQLSVRSADDVSMAAATDDERKIHTLRVYAYADIPDDPSKDGRLVGYYYTDRVTEVPHKFTMDITFYQQDRQNVNFYVVANEGAMSTPGSGQQALGSNTTEQQLNDYWFTSLSSDIVNDGLPMFYKSEQSVALQKGTPSSISPFHLKRPVGKLGVFAAKPQGEVAELKITGLTMLEAGTRAYNYLMPPSKDKLETQHVYGDIPLSPVKEAVDKVLNENQINSETERKNPNNYTPVLAAPFYPFENPWGSTDWTQKEHENGNVLQIDYTFGVETRSGLVYLPPIERNHYYAVCCLMRNDGTISVEYTVADWNSEVWDLVFDYPTYGFLVPSDDMGIDIDPTTNKYPQPTVWFNSDEALAGTYSFKFWITGPEGQQWTPTFLDKPGILDLTVWQNGKKIEKKEDLIASPDPYIIKVKALDSNNANTEVQLGISYNPAWSDQSSFLLISGLTNNLKWEGTQYAEIIVIKQTDGPTN